jgi:peptidoglycan LD-endopeptidase LytH
MLRLRAARTVLAAGCITILAIAGATTHAAASSRSATDDRSGGDYQVRFGDTLSALALRFRTTIRELSALNRIDDPDRIVAGRNLVLPGAAPAAAPAAPTAPASVTPATGLAGARHTVGFGETLGGIAARYGIPWRDLARWNGIVGERVYATTSLVLYDPGPLPSNPIVCPVRGGRFFNDWAFPRSAGRVHAGIDLFAPRGTPVRAPVAGTVTTTRGSTAGLQVSLTDGAGNTWLGTHLSAFAAVGKVKAGDVIGYVGTTGNAAGSRPHLHLEYHPAGRGAVNPYPLLRAAC